MGKVAPLGDGWGRAEQALNSHLSYYFTKKQMRCFSVFKFILTKSFVWGMIEISYKRTENDMEQKRFTKNDDTFICKNCGLEVKPLGYSSRNHCPRCLCSLHVDINPGDRANPCKGLLRPIKVEPDPSFPAVKNAVRSAETAPPTKQRCSRTISICSLNWLLSDKYFCIISKK